MICLGWPYIQTLVRTIAKDVASAIEPCPWDTPHIARESTPYSARMPGQDRWPNPYSGAFPLRIGYERWTKPALAKTMAVARQALETGHPGGPASSHDTR